MMYPVNTIGRVMTSAAVLFCCCYGLSAWSADLKPIKLDPGYDHARYSPAADITREFAAFTVSFDSKDDDNEDGKPDLLRVPEWVAQHIKRTDEPCIDTHDRPSWFTDKDLFRSGVAPDDDSYKHSGFDRGHMAAKLLAARVSEAAEWNTHTVLNAVPQRRRFNQQIWKNLEAWTGAWTQVFGEIWVIQGPVFGEHAPFFFIGDEGEYKVAVPDALFKVVIREKTASEKAVASAKEKNLPEMLVFLYPQLGPGYYWTKTEFPHEGLTYFRHERFLTTLEEVEKLTKLTFFDEADALGINASALKRLRKQRAEKLWQATDEDFLNACKN